MNLQDAVYCEGACEEHIGNVKHVHVYKPSTDADWGWFWYCEAAIENDKKAGFTVEEEADDGN